MALRRYALLMGAVGRSSESIAMTKKAIELDPLSSVTWANLGILLTGARQFADAHAAISRALEIQPESPYALSDLGSLQLLQGHATEALATAQQSDGHNRLSMTAMAEHSLGHADQSQRALEALIAQFDHDCAYCVARVYAWRGEKDQAFAWLQRAFAQRDSGLTEIKYDGVVDSLRGDPRYLALMHRLNLPE
jgi:tetratricopeptide (TPR) repeat protein